MEKIEKYLEAGRPVSRVKLTSSRMSVSYLAFHEIDFDLKYFCGKFVKFNKKECLENVEMLIPSTIQGGKPTEQTLTRVTENTKLIPIDLIREIEVIESDHADYSEIKEYVATYIAKVKANKANAEKAE